MWHQHRVQNAWQMEMAGRLSGPWLLVTAPSETSGGGNGPHELPSGVAASLSACGAEVVEQRPFPRKVQVQAQAQAAAVPPPTAYRVVRRARSGHAPRSLDEELTAGALDAYAARPAVLVEVGGDAALGDFDACCDTVLVLPPPARYLDLAEGLEDDMALLQAAWSFSRNLRNVGVLRFASFSESATRLGVVAPSSSATSKPPQPRVPIARKEKEHLQGQEGLVGIGKKQGAKRTGWGGGARAKTHMRFSIFSGWLQEAFGVERLRSGSGVLDVAGGKGELAFRLLNYADVRTTIVDPRPIDVIAMMRNLTTAHVARLQERQGSTKTITVPVPEHIRCFFWSPQSASPEPGVAHTAETSAATSETCTAEERSTPATPRSTEELSGTSAETGACAEPATGAGAAHRPAAHRVGGGPDYAGDELCDSAGERRRLERALQSCSAIVGMHSDQATEAIVDWGLALQRPFATVPCCVFPELFAHRKHVRKYDAFCDWLLAKDAGRVATHELPFPGRNRVICSMYHGVATQTSTKSDAEIAANK